MNRCYECSCPVGEGQTYCKRCASEDEKTVQIELPIKINESAA